MSFKGIAWAGNVYEKFETMCLEVEEAMYQDTVKYMENQAQKVGVSVKKFYSEVMEDLQSLSCVDPTTVASDDLFLISHGYTDVDKNPTPKTLKKGNEGQVVSNVTAEKGSSLSSYDVSLFSPQSPGIFIENKSSEKFGGGKKLGVNRRPIGIKRISRNNHALKQSCMDAYVPSDRISRVANLTSSSDLNGRFESREACRGDAPIESRNTVKILPSESVREGTCDDANVTSSSDVETREAGEAVKGDTLFRDDIIESPASETVLPDESVRPREDVSDRLSSDSANNLSRLKEDPKSTSSCSVSPAQSTGTAMKDGGSTSSSTSFDTDFITREDMDDGFEIEFVEHEEVAGLRLENFETCGSVNLEESCVLVEGEELHCPLQGTKKHKSYERRIREALLPKMKPKRDDEFAVSRREGGEDIGSEKKKLDRRNSVESDWELL